MTSPAEMLDPDGPPPEEAGLYGFDVARADARVVVLPVPVECTTSYRTGTRGGPEAIRRASHQVDLYDVDVGEPYRAGICLEPPLEGVVAGDARARKAAERVIAATKKGSPPAAKDLKAVNAFQEGVRERLFTWTSAALDAGKLPVVLGGDHSVPLGAIEAAARGRRSLGVLHVDAHADLRVAYEGFEQSHASIMHNVLARAANVTLVQVGLRDVSGTEVERVQRDARIRAVFAPALRRARLSGSVADLLRMAVQALPDDVWLSFDVDGLDALYCPSTGTPVPGGLTFDELVQLLEEVARAKKRVVGMDLCEVAPGDDEWDALVGARVLYKMIGTATGSRSEVA